MITHLDEISALDPQRVGAKAAALARGRRAGLPTLPGFIVESSVSTRHMDLGWAALGTRGSGGARLAVAAEPVPGAAQIEAAGSCLGDSLAARSSTTLESNGTWAGAFTSYLGITPGELPQAVAGCWASAFTVDALERHHHSGSEPGPVAMAVLVQPAIEPTLGGVAEIDPTGTVMVNAVAGHPAALLRGWERGVTARRTDDGWHGAEAVGLIGTETLDRIASLLDIGRLELGYDRCEWAVGDGLWILQLGVAARPPTPTVSLPAAPSELIPFVRSLVTNPGVLGEELVRRWALGGSPGSVRLEPTRGTAIVDEAVELSASLTAQVWGLEPSEAIEAADAVLARLRGPEPAATLPVIRSLAAPDREKASRLLSIIRSLDERLVSEGVLRTRGTVWHLSVAELEMALRGESVRVPGRVGFGVWEPLVAAVALEHGTSFHGNPAASGIGAGTRHHVEGLDTGAPHHRAVITASNALPNLSQLVWDAAGLVTEGGSPVAHVFESARSIGVPAVCGVDVGPDRDVIIAVDGFSGRVATLPLASQLRADPPRSGDVGGRAHSIP